MYLLGKYDISKLHFTYYFSTILHLYWIYFTYHKLHPFKAHSSVLFKIFSELCNHHYILIFQLFSMLKPYLLTGTSHCLPQAPATQPQAVWVYWPLVVLCLCLLDCSFYNNYIHSVFSSVIMKIIHLSIMHLQYFKAVFSFVLLCWWHFFLYRSLIFFRFLKWFIDFDSFINIFPPPIIKLFNLLYPLLVFYSIMVCLSFNPSLV